MVIKFNTADNIAKEELLFTKFISQITLMKKNSLKHPRQLNATYNTK